MAHREILPTGVSQVMWCDPAQGYKFSSAKIPVMQASGQESEPVFWLDQILGGGFVLPTTSNSGRALTVLLAGPPGTGKSTLALELCYRWSFENVAGKKTSPLRTLYLTSEAHEPWMRSNANALGWSEIDKRIVTDISAWKPGTILVLNAGDTEQLQRKLNRFLPREGETDKFPKPRFWEDLFRLFFPGHSERSTGESVEGPIAPDVVVIDSLNTLPKQEERERLFQSFMRLVGAGPKVLVAVLNSSAGGPAAEFWEFATDVVIRLDRREAKSYYLIRTIEIVKARYQEHAFGKHQLKTYQKEVEREVTEKDRKEFDATFEALRRQAAHQSEGHHPDDQFKRYAERASKLIRAHPYRSVSDGGLAIFPSIHYVLSRYKRATPTEAGEPIQSAMSKLTSLLHEGYPRGRCTAFIGGRGGHKSHLAYVELLHRIIQGNGREKALVVSLRDDEGVSRQTMEKILKNRWQTENPHPQLLQNPHLQLLKWEAEGLLEVTYYPPGYITPEEFFHRLMLSINRLKAGSPKETHITLLFNSLDQLSSRFPLCVEEEVFVPGIIQMLSGEGVSSFVVAAREERRPDYYGLQTMAELILDFERQTLKRSEMLRYVTQTFSVNEKQKRALLRRYPKEHQAVVVSVVRHAGGQAAGSKAVLELAEEEDPLREVCSEKDLVVLPFLKQQE
jgi:KaiC/GvpD/RAD55 family RecA-like ATPase